MSPNLSLVTQAWRFVVTGGLSAIVDFGLYVLMYKALGLNPDLSQDAQLHRRHRYGLPDQPQVDVPGAARVPPAFVAVVALYAVTFSVQVGLNHLFLHLLHYTATAVVVAFLIAQGTATVINFVVQRTVIFKVK